MLAKTVPLAFLVLWCACNGPPDPDPPITTTTTPTTTTTIPPPPPPPPKLSDYISIADKDSIIEWRTSNRVGLRAGEQAMAAAGWRDVEYVSNHCHWAWGDYFPMNSAQAGVFAADGTRYALQAQAFMAGLSETNRRCSPDHPQHHPGFCAVTNVRVSAFVPFGAYGDATTPRGVFWEHLDKADDLRAIAGQCRAAITSAGGLGYDSIKGWCQAMNVLGWATRNCLS